MSTGVYLLTSSSLYSSESEEEEDADEVPYLPLLLLSAGVESVGELKVLKGRLPASAPVFLAELVEVVDEVLLVEVVTVLVWW